LKNLFAVVQVAGGVFIIGAAKAADSCGVGCHTAPEGECVIDGWNAGAAPNECPAKFLSRRLSLSVNGQVGLPLPPFEGHFPWPQMPSVCGADISSGSISTDTGYLSPDRFTPVSHPNCGHGWWSRLCQRQKIRSASQRIDIVEGDRVTSRGRLKFVASLVSLPSVRSRQRGNGLTKNIVGHRPTPRGASIAGR
jgi:hypothetical protein